MVTHIVGGGVGVVSLTLSVIFAAIFGNVWGVVSSAIFGSTMIVLYSVSSVYHGLSPRLGAKRVFRVLDHCSIFLLIAGTYTPFALCSLREYNTALGWTIFGIEWGMAAVGIVLNSISFEKYKIPSLICYLVMGWCIICTGKIVFSVLGFGGSFFLFAGGVAYTVGAVLYCIGKKKKFIHSVFHIFVVIGSLLHFFSIFFYVIR